MDMDDGVLIINLLEMLLFLVLTMVHQDIQKTVTIIF